MTGTDSIGGREETNRSIVGWLAAPIDIASLAAFRILFGIVMGIAMLRFLARGWVSQLYLEPRFLVPYPGFEWIQPWSPLGMHLHFVGLAVLAFMVALGWYYRAAIILFTVGFAYVELLDQTAFLNHYYLITLLSAILMVLPAHKAWSIDSQRIPGMRVEVVQKWTVYLLRFQLAVVYLFAGIAKLNADWLLRAQPMRIWLNASSDIAIIGPFLEMEWVAFVSSWVGAVYDLSIVFFLLWSKTRKWAFVAVIGFHVATWGLFSIGMFPWIMIVSSTVFFAPDWSRSLLSKIERVAKRIAGSLGYPNEREGTQLARNVPVETGQPANRLLVASLGIYAAIQIILPLRPYLFANEHPAWSYNGFNLAWQVMVAEKTGCVDYYVRDAENTRPRRVDLREYLKPRQIRLLAQDPHLIRTFAQVIARDLESRGTTAPAVYAEAFATLNGWPSQRLIDQGENLVGEESENWIIPLSDRADL